MTPETREQLKSLRLQRKGWLPGGWLPGWWGVPWCHGPGTENCQGEGCEGCAFVAYKRERAAEIQVRVTALLTPQIADPVPPDADELARLLAELL